MLQRILNCVGILLLLSESVWARPDWADGRSLRFPHGAYLIGVGEGESREKAESAALANLAKIFNAEIHQETSHQEQYRVAGSKEESRHRVELHTEVSTDKILEGAEIVETAYEEPVYYALAVIDRLQATTRLTEQIQGLDREIRQRVTVSKTTPDTITRVRNYKKALKTFALREDLNADLAIVGVKGEGIPSPLSFVTIEQALRADLQNFLVSVQITGDSGGVVQNAVTDALRQEGLASGPRLKTTDKKIGASAENLLIEGHTTLLPVTLAGQPFHYIRWCVSLTLHDDENKTVAGILLSGREGHLSKNEAQARALRALQPKVISEVLTRVAEYLSDTPQPIANPPSGCAENSP